MAGREGFLFNFIQFLVMTNKIIVVLFFSCLLLTNVVGQGFMKSYGIPNTYSNNGAAILADTSSYTIVSNQGSVTTDYVCLGAFNINKDGVEQWNSLLESNVFISNPNQDIEKINDTSFILSGGIGYPGNPWQALIAKLNTLDHTFQITELGDVVLEDGISDVDMLNNDTMIAAFYYADVIPYTYAHASLLRLCPDLSLLDSIYIGNVSGYAFSYIYNLLLENEHFYILMWCRSNNDKRYLVVRKTDLQGNTIWEYPLDTYTTATNTPTQIDVLPNGNIVTHWFDEGNGGASDERNPYLICLSPDDSLVWRYNFNDDGYEKNPIAISVAANGDIIGCGYTQRLDYNYYSGWLFRMSSEGELLWEREYISYTAAVNFLLLEGIDEDVDGNIVATGMVVDPVPIGGYEGHALLLKVLPNGCFTPDCAGGGEDTLIVASTVLGVESAPKPSSASSVFSLLLYPNPADDVVRLLLPTAAAYNRSAVVVCDLSGRVLRRFDLGSGGGASGTLLAIPTHDLVNGMYVVQYVEAGRVKGVGKMVVLR